MDLKIQKLWRSLNSKALEELNRGNFDKAAHEWAEWRKAGGEVSDGLDARRRDEIRLFLTGNY